MRTARTLMSNVEAVEATKQLRNTRRSGHRIENVPLTEYQMSQSNMMLALCRDIPRRMVVIDSPGSPGLSTWFWPYPPRSESAWRR